jgi:hypothetical protein
MRRSRRIKGIPCPMTPEPLRTLQRGLLQVFPLNGSRTERNRRNPKGSWVLRIVQLGRELWAFWVNVPGLLMFVLTDDSTLTIAQVHINIQYK